MGDSITERLSTLSPQEKRALLARLQAGQVQKPKVAPLSLAQERVLSLCQFEPDNPGYNITAAYRLTGPLDIAVLEQSLNQIIRRQAALRTAFTQVDGQPVQLIAPELTLKLAVQDLEAIPQTERELQVRQRIIRQAQRPFDLSRAPLLAASLLRLSPEDHVLALTTHRMVFDGQCWPVLIAELSAFCEAYSTGKSPTLPELPLQYADFAAWQREWLKGEALDTQLAYWRERLGGQIRLLSLPIDHPRTAAQFRSTLHTFTLPEDLSDALRSLSQQEGVSLFVTLLTAFQLLLYRYTSQEDFLIFSSVAGRNRLELKGLLGLFANLLALRADLSGDPTFRELLGRARETAAGAYAHQDVPFEQILEMLQVERDQSYASVFQAMFVFWPEPLPPVEWPGLILSPLDIDVKPAEFDLLLHVTHTRPAMTGMLRYKADLFEASSMVRLLERFQNLLADVALHPQRHLSELAVSKVRAEQGSITGSLPILPSQWSYLRTPHLWVNMVEVVELQQRLNPALLAQAVQHIFEHHDALRTHFVYEGGWRQFIPTAHGETPFTCVDISECPLAEHDDAIQAALASVQSSLGPLQDALIHVVLFDRGAQQPEYLVFTVHHVISDNASLPILLEDLHTLYRQLSRNEPVRLPAKTTSLKAWAEQFETYLYSTEFQDRLRQELALFQNSIVPLPIDYPEGRHQNTLDSTAHLQAALSADETSILLKEFPRVYKVWLMDILLTALLQALTHWSGGRRAVLSIVDAGRNLALPEIEEIDLSRTVGCLFVPGVLMLERPDCDDPLEALQLVREQLSRFPTYGTCVGIAQQVERYPEARRLPPAELRLNYLGQPSFPNVDGWSPHTSTALEDFVANRRHGDIDRNPVLLNCTAVILDGRLIVDWEYSRNLHQRATLERVAHDFVDALQSLVRRYQVLREESGGTDPGLNRAFVAPRTPTEELLARIWAQALGREQVGVYDNFFELGGDSLTGLRILARANQMGLPLTPKRLFENQTVAELAATIQVEPDAVTGPLPLTPAQHWLLEQAPPDVHRFNQTLILELKPHVEPARLEAALRQLVERHAELRLRFEQTAAGWQATYADSHATAFLGVLDLSMMPEGQQELSIENAADQFPSSLNLATGPLMGAALFDRGEQRSACLLIIIHRLIVDRVSWQIVLEDLDSVYRQLGANRPIHLPAKTASFKRWAKHLVERAQTEEVKQELGYWLDESRKRLPSLPVDQADGADTASSAQTLSMSLTAEETHALLSETPKAYQTKTDEVLLAALAQTFAHWTGGPFLLLDLEGGGRDSDFSRTLGWFAPIFPMLLNLSAAKGPREALVSTKEQLRRVPHHGVNYGVLRYLSEDMETAGPLRTLHSPEISFSYLDLSAQIFSDSSVYGSIWAFTAGQQGMAGLRRYLLEITASVDQGCLKLLWTYSSNRHRRSTIESLAQTYYEALKALIVHCQSPEAGAYTPSDFAEFKWNERYLEDIAAEINKAIG